MQIYIVLDSMLIAVDMAHNTFRTNRPTIECLVHIFKTLFWLIGIKWCSALDSFTTKDEIISRESMALLYIILELCHWVQAARQDAFNGQSVRKSGISAENSTKDGIGISLEMEKEIFSSTSAYRNRTEVFWNKAQ